MKQGIFIGICIAITVLSVWQVLRMENRLRTVENTTVNVVNFLNSQVAPK